MKNQNIHTIMAAIRIMVTTSVEKGRTRKSMGKLAIKRMARRWSLTGLNHTSAMSITSTMAAWSRMKLEAAPTTTFPIMPAWWRTSKSVSSYALL
ncbi:MAG: hypothetical protein PHO53_01040 [Actinomycetota bacterium]|nr:hypothetical protein [Actinomycetota bacterium]